MMTLADEIAKLADPRPNVLDPEDDINVETRARTVERFDESSNILAELSSLRQKTSLLLEDIDTRYTGKKISRQSFGQTYEAGTESSSDDESDVAIDEDLKRFKQQIPGSIDLQNSSQEFNDNSPSQEAVCDESEENDSTNKSQTGTESDEEQETEDDMLTKFSHIDVSEEIEKGKAVEAQLGLWNKLCESRIRFQKIIISANRLPQFDVWSDFKNRGDKNYSGALKKGPVAIKSLLDSMLEMQSHLLVNNPEMKNFLTMVDSPSAQENDEEILSESENESERSSSVQNKGNFLEGETKKRKLGLDEYDDILAKRFKKFGAYRNSIIQKWDDKTHLITGRMSQKSFSAFNQSALMQINQILQDKQRLIRRTQLKRSVYRILGKNEENESNTHQCEEKNEVVDGHSRRDEHLNCYDTEIFDDDDFYRLLLKDIIETKTIGMDPDILRTHMELQKNRRKMKKKVDTKASKGRKLRYDPHPKMVNFMACVSSLYPEGTRTDLFKRVFSQSPAIHAQ